MAKSYDAIILQSQHVYRPIQDPYYSSLLFLLPIKMNLTSYNDFPLSH